MVWLFQERFQTVGVEADENFIADAMVCGAADCRMEHERVE